MTEIVSAIFCCGEDGAAPVLDPLVRLPFVCRFLAGLLTLRSLSPGAIRDWGCCGVLSAFFICAVLSASTGPAPASIIARQVLASETVISSRISSRLSTAAPICSQTGRSSITARVLMAPAIHLLRRILGDW